jgi:hypothetical protein
MASVCSLGERSQPAGSLPSCSTRSPRSPHSSRGASRVTHLRFFQTHTRELICTRRMSATSPSKRRLTSAGSMVSGQTRASNMTQPYSLRAPDTCGRTRDSGQQSKGSSDDKWMNPGRRAGWIRPAGSIPIRSRRVRRTRAGGPFLSARHRTAACRRRGTPRTPRSRDDSACRHRVATAASRRRPTVA